MAILNTGTYNDQKAARANTSRQAAENVVDGNVQYAVIPYTLTASEATGDVINLCVLPEGAIPIPQLSKVTCSADPGTTLTLNIGNTQAADGWAKAITLSSGGDIWATSGTMPAFAAPTRLVRDSSLADGTTVIYATVATAATLTAGVVLYFVLAYKPGK